MRNIILLIPLTVLLSCTNSRVEELEAEISALKDSIEIIRKEAELQAEIAIKMAEEANKSQDQAMWEKSRLDSLIKLQD